MASKKFKERLLALAEPHRGPGGNPAELHKLLRVAEGDDAAAAKFLVDRGLMTAEEAGIKVRDMTDPNTGSRNDTGSVNIWGKA